MQHVKLHTHTHTNVSFVTLDVLSVVQSESAIISNTIFFAVTILPFLKEYGSKKRWNDQVAIGIILMLSLQKKKYMRI